MTLTTKDDDMRVIRNLIDPSNKLDMSQIELFMHVCKTRGLDPRLKQIYAVPRNNRNTGKVELTIQVSIDGFRLIAERTGKYAPGRATDFGYDDNGKLIAATAYVKKLTADGTWHEISATAFLSEYKPKFNAQFWDQMPSVMLEKCAESRALRRAFPSDFSGLYSEEEMDQAEAIDAPVIQVKKIEPSVANKMRKALDNHPDVLKKLLQMSGKKSIEEIEEDQLEGCRVFVDALLKKKEVTNEN